jgi:O-6-methylguanine DNA methyltransferase
MTTRAPARGSERIGAREDGGAREGELVRRLATLQVAAPPALVATVLAALRSPDSASSHRYVRVEGPSGALYVVFGERGITHVFAVALAGEEREDFEAMYRKLHGLEVREAARPPAGLGRALRSGNARGLRYDLGEMSPFGMAVLAKALEIPAGEVRPYSWIAREIGHPAAVRAVGTALGRNPVPVLIPCHRVVRSDGTIGQYALGSTMKVALLGREGVDVDGLVSLAASGVHLLGSDTTHIFCHPTCRHARRITEAHRVRFKDAGDAATAGYRPCRDCRPAALSA